MRRFPIERARHAHAPQRPELRALLARLRRRRAQRGAALFLVVMVMTIAAAIGVFAMRSASLADLAVGYSRQSAQAGLVADYAARVTANYLERNPGLANNTDRISGCAPALLAADPNASCTVFKTSLLADSLETPVLNGLPTESPVYGELSDPASDTRIDAEFVTEMTEPSMANISASPGFTAGQFRQVTFTSIARVYPTDVADTESTGVCSNAARGAITQQTVRAHVIIPL